MKYKIINNSTVCRNHRIRILFEFGFWNMTSSRFVIYCIFLFEYYLLDYIYDRIELVLQASKLKQANLIG